MKEELDSEWSKLDVFFRRALNTLRKNLFK